MRPSGVKARVRRVWTEARPAETRTETVWDRLAPEDPLEIRVGEGVPRERAIRTVTITMRTPGHDDELAAGFLLSERLIDGPEAVAEIVREDPEDADGLDERIIRVNLEPDAKLDASWADRPSFVHSSCGVCGTSTLEALRLSGRRPMPGAGPVLNADLIRALPERLRRRQSVFEATGGLHAAALVDAEGSVIAVREDIGRHNTVDKLIGARALGTCEGPAAESDPAALVVSGRAGFEIVQKAVTASIPILVAVGAPSSLAVEVAETFGLTLVGFTKADRFNIYAAPWRIRIASSQPVKVGRR